MSDTAVQVAPLAQNFLDIVLPILSAVTLVVGSWLSKLLIKKWNLDIEALHRDALQTTLTNAAGLIRAKVGKDTQGITVDLGNPVWADAVKYVAKSAPAAQEYFKLTPEAIAEKVAAKLPQIDPDIVPPVVVEPTLSRATGRRPLR